VEAIFGRGMKEEEMGIRGEGLVLSGGARAGSDRGKVQ